MKTTTTVFRYAFRFLAVAGLACGLASATTIEATGVDWARGQSIWIQEDGVDKSAYFAGVILITVTDGGQQYSRDSLCVDLFTDININTVYDTTILHPYQVPGKNLPRVSWLVDNAMLPTQEPTYVSALSSGYWVTTAAQGAGIQLAIWDIVHDGGDGFSAGRVQAVTNPSNPTDSNVLSWANTYEALSAGNSSAFAFIYNNVNMGNGVPAQMLAGPRFADGGPVPNPEPATFLMAGAALIGLSRFARRRRAER